MVLFVASLVLSVVWTLLSVASLTIRRLASFFRRFGSSIHHFDVSIHDLDSSFRRSDFIRHFGSFFHHFLDSIRRFKFNMKYKKTVANSVNIRVCLQSKMTAMLVYQIVESFYKALLIVVSSFLLSALLAQWHMPVLPLHC